MSADNWGLCPVCFQVAVKAEEQKKQRVVDDYGVIPAEEYLSLVEEANTPIKLEDTLREDYSVSTNVHGMFYITYSCRCTKCGFSFKFTHTEEVKDAQNNP